MSTCFCVRHPTETKVHLLETLQKWSLQKSLSFFLHSLKNSAQCNLVCSITSTHHHIPLLPSLLIFNGVHMVVSDSHTSTLDLQLWKKAFWVQLLDCCVDCGQWQALTGDLCSDFSRTVFRQNLSSMGKLGEDNLSSCSNHEIEGPQFVSASLDSSLKHKTYTNGVQHYQAANIPQQILVVLWQEFYSLLIMLKVLNCNCFNNL